jgi:hypothetical protein
MSVKRATHFLNKVIALTFAIIGIFLVLAVIESLFHPFTPWIDEARVRIADAERLLTANSLRGISFGMIALTLVVCVLPLLMPSVNKKQYRTNTARGVLASVVFFLSQGLYGWAESFGKLHLIGAMLLAIAVTIIVIEFLALLTRVDEERSLRTDLLSSCAAGLASGIVLKLIEVLVNQMKALA